MNKMKYHKIKKWRQHVSTLCKAKIDEFNTYAGKPSDINCKECKQKIKELEKEYMEKLKRAKEQSLKKIELAKAKTQPDIKKLKEYWSRIDY